MDPHVVVLCTMVHALRLDSLLIGLCSFGGMALLPALFLPSHHMPKLTCLQKQCVCQWRLCLRELDHWADSRCFVYSGFPCLLWTPYLLFFYSFSFKTPWLCQHLPLTVQIRKFLLFPLQTHGRKKSSCAQPSSASPAEVKAQRPVCLYRTKPIS